MMPKARIYKEKGAWLMSVSFFPRQQKLELYTFLSFADAAHGLEVYRMSFLNALAGHAAASQVGLVH